MVIDESSTNTGSRRPGPTRFDPFLDDAYLREIYQLLQSGEWVDFGEALEHHEDPWVAKSILTSNDAAIETVVFQRFHEAMPSAGSLSLLGGAQVRDAWNILDTIDPDMAEAEFARIDARFQESLATAEETLQQAVILRPALADPWIHLLNSGRGLGIDLQELRTRFENAHSRMPFRPDACHQYLLGLSSRGGGADGAMFDLARWLQAEAPTYSSARMALPMAHLEYGLSDSSNLTLTEHLSLEETVDELTPALAAFLLATPSEAESSQLLVLNAFGLAMTVNSEETARLTRECFRRIDNRPTSYPWSLYEDEEIVDVFNEVQRTQLRAAERFE